MRFIIQRVQHASVTIEGEVKGKIGKGFLVLVGIGLDDDEKVADKLRKQFHLPLYDKAHLLKAVEGTEEYDELNAFFNDRKVNSLLYAIAMSASVRANDVPFGIIKNIIGDTGGIVMDGCGNYLFRNRPNTVRIFLHANKDIRINNLVTHLGMTKEQARKEIEFQLS